MENFLTVSFERFFFAAFLAIGTPPKEVNG
jgi:hypothetical protein